MSTLNSAPSALQVTATAADDARQAQGHQPNGWPKVKYVHGLAQLRLGYDVEKWAGNYTAERRRATVKLTVSR